MVSEKILLTEMKLSMEDEKNQLGQRRMDEKIQAIGPKDGKPKVCPKCGACRVRRFSTGPKGKVAW
jgi:hypothetical protein